MDKVVGKPRKMDNRNRITIPPEVVQLLDIKPDDEVYFKLSGERVFVGKATKKYEFFDKIKKNNKIR